MVDNGLMKACQGNTTKDGYLILPKKSFNTTPYSYTNSKRIDKMFYQGEEYFLKLATKTEIEAEVLLSQIAILLGLDCAIYLPVKTGFMQKVVASNNVKQQDYISSREYCSGGARYTVKSLILPKELGERDLKYYSQFIEKDAMCNLIKTRLFQTASNNDDGNKDNMFYKLDENGIIQNVSSIDNAMAANRGIGGTFYNEFSDEQLSLEEMICNFRENETMQQFITANELAESLGSINVSKVAKDIFHTMDFKIGQGLVDDISFSYDNVAEQLIL